MKNAKIDQSIGGNKEVGKEAADHIEVRNEDADEGDGEDKDVATDGIVVGTPARSKDLGCFFNN